jgi:hypothetical protein
VEEGRFGQGSVIRECLASLLDLFSVSSSIAGLAAARICHDHFERVIIVEPEAWLTTPEGWESDREPMKRVRARVMQYQSLHGKSAAYTSPYTIDELTEQK